MKRLLVVAVASWLVVQTAPITDAATVTYRQPLFLEWNRSPLDVIVIPPSHGQVVNGTAQQPNVLNGASADELNPMANSYLKATLKAIGDWRRAVSTYGSSSLRKRFKLRVYVLGRDDVPSSALTEPEIVMAWDEWKAVFIGVSAHTGGPPCVSAASKFFITSFSYRDMYNVAGHEFGHCLGLGHSFGSRATKTISHDIMFGTYEDEIGLSKTHLHCMSNLNVAGLELAFDRKSNIDAVARMRSTSYRRIRC